MSVSDILKAAAKAGGCELLRVHMPIAIGHGHIGIAPKAAPNLATEGRAVSVGLDSDLR
ncbi:MAG: hypothetical protein U1E41_16810 [Paracoccus sp. (in: a-proteobacteria)]